MPILFEAADVCFELPRPPSLLHLRRQYTYVYFDVVIAMSSGQAAAEAPLSLFITTCEAVPLVPGVSWWNGKTLRKLFVVPMVWSAAFRSIKGSDTRYQIRLNLRPCLDDKW